MLLKCTSISSARAVRQPNRGSPADPPFTHHHWLGYSGKEHPGMDHIGTEMLVLDQPPVPGASRFRGRSIRWYSIFHALQPSFSSSTMR
jgi:hypothetical protein